MDPALWPWLALGIGVAAGLATGLWIIRDDRPTNVSGWATASFAALYFGAAVGFGVWIATRNLSLPWWPMMLLLGGLGALGYARIGLAYAAWEWKAGDVAAMAESGRLLRLARAGGDDDGLDGGGGGLTAYSRAMVTMV